MSYTAINIKEKLALISQHWQPKAVAALNDYHLKLAKIRGDFVWHSHPETDELFLVLEGAMRIDFRDGAVSLQTGEMFVVQKGVEHKPYAAQECSLLLIEPAGTVNTGDSGGELTADSTEWI